MTHNQNYQNYQNNKPLTKEEIDFLSTVVPRLFVYKEIDYFLDYIPKPRLLKQVNIKNKIHNITDGFITKNNIKQKNRIIKMMAESDCISMDLGRVGLVAYKIIPEPDDVFLKRIKLGGQELLGREKNKHIKKLKKEGRKVLFEKKVIKKKKEKSYLMPDFRRIDYYPNPVIDLEEIPF